MAASQVRDEGMQPDREGREDGGSQRTTILGQQLFVTAAVLDVADNKCCLVGGCIQLYISRGVARVAAGVSRFRSLLIQYLKQQGEARRHREWHAWGAFETGIHRWH